jgi:hypothetical protein
MGGKWLQLLLEIAPATARVALLFNPATSPPLRFYLPSIQAAAWASRIQVNPAPVNDKDEIETVIAALARDPGGSLIVMPMPALRPSGHVLILDHSHCDLRRSAVAYGHPLDEGPVLRAAQRALRCGVAGQRGNSTRSNHRFSMAQSRRAPRSTVLASRHMTPKSVSGHRRQPAEQVSCPSGPG